MTGLEIGLIIAVVLFLAIIVFFVVQGNKKRQKVASQKANADKQKKDIEDKKAKEFYERMQIPTTLITATPVAPVVVQAATQADTPQAEAPQPAAAENRSNEKGAERKSYEKTPVEKREGRMSERAGLASAEKQGRVGGFETNRLSKERAAMRYQYEYEDDDDEIPFSEEKWSEIQSKNNLRRIDEDSVFGKPVKDQIKSLSPEMKALLMGDVLKKRKD